MGRLPAGAQSSWFGWQITELSLKYPQRSLKGLQTEARLYFKIQLCKSLGVTVFCFLWSLAQTWLFLCFPLKIAIFQLLWLLAAPYRCVSGTLAPWDERVS